MTRGLALLLVALGLPHAAGLELSLDAPSEVVPWEPAQVPVQVTVPCSEALALGRPESEVAYILVTLHSEASQMRVSGATTLVLDKSPCRTDPQGRLLRHHTFSLFEEGATPAGEPFDLTVEAEVTEVGPGGTGAHVLANATTRMAWRPSPSAEGRIDRVDAKTYRITVAVRNAGNGPVEASLAASTADGLRLSTDGPVVVPAWPAPGTGYLYAVLPLDGGNKVVSGPITVIVAYAEPDGPGELEADTLVLTVPRSQSVGLAAWPLAVAGVAVALMLRRRSSHES